MIAVALFFLNTLPSRGSCSTLNITEAKALADQGKWLLPPNERNALAPLPLMDPEGAELKATSISIPFGFTGYYDSENDVLVGATGDVGSISHFASSQLLH